MKFNDLFTRVIITEQDEDPTLSSSDIDTDTPAITDDGVPMPDSYNVKPAPVSPISNNSGNIKNYISKLEDFAKTLNDDESDSLQKLVTELDRPGSLFQGISRETSSEIIRLAEQTASLAQILKGFIINSAKRQRDIAAGQ
jgi:hypothetical protein